MAINLEASFALAVFLIAVMSGVFLLLALYEENPRRRLSCWVRAVARPWDFSPAQAGGFGWFQLALASVLSLFLEMLMIRWVSSEISVLAYFKNVVLISAFLGFGLGYYFCRRTVNLLGLVFPLCLLVSLLCLPWVALQSAIRKVPYFIALTSDFDFVGGPGVSTGLFASLSAIVLLVFLFALVSFIFIPLGQIVGWSLESAADGILAYTVNVIASLAGIVLYTLLCFWYQPPAVWFALSGLMLAILLRKVPVLMWTSLAAFTVCVAFVSIGPRAPIQELWSPYQKILLTPLPADHPIEYQLKTNGEWYQKIINLSPSFVAAHPKLFQQVPVEAVAYNIPYRFYPNPPSVLVLGAGTGNDVAAAVRNGAGRVVAVEIDPLILELGRKLHFEHPYDSPKVHVVLDDARSYIQNSRDQFDLIVFSLLDSHTDASYYSNIRTDNYVYTLQAFQSAKRLLKPDGVFIVKFWVTTPWIAGRLYELVNTVFGQAPVDMNALQSSYNTPGRFFIAGSAERIQHVMNDPERPSYLSTDDKVGTSEAQITTDDWPYFYQRERGIPLSLKLLCLALVAFCWLALKRTGVDLSCFRWHFFFLGAGFMLLEAQIVSKMALLFGTTWLVNSIVVGGLLLLIAAANLLVRGIPDIPYDLAYAGILVSLGVNYLVPLDEFFLPNVWMKALVATSVLCLPVFFAGIVFIRSFRKAGFEGRALGTNLFGALVGGLLESMSLWTGIKSLVLLAAVLYGASYLTLRSGIAFRTTEVNQ
jgi:spermidine synthase